MGLDDEFTSKAVEGVRPLPGMPSGLCQCIAPIT